MKKTLSTILLLIMAIVMAVVATGCFDEDDSTSQSESPSQSSMESPNESQSTGDDSSDSEEEKKDAAAVTDLSVTTKAVARFTALDGFEYQFVIDGSEVEVEEVSGKYDVSEFVSSASKTHTVAVYSKENDEYKKSELSNVVNVKAIDTDSVNFAVTADKKVTFNAVEGYEYYLSVNGTETKVTAGQDVSALLAGGENVSTIVKLVIKGSVSGDTVTLDTVAKEIITITWHKAITNFAYENGVVTFANELNYTYDLYANNEVLKANVASGDDISDLIADRTEKELTLFVKVKENAAKSAFVSTANEKSNDVVLKFLSAPEATATVNNGVITLTITDTDNTDVEELVYELFIDGDSVGTVTNEQNISTLFTKKGDAKLSLKAIADGYVSSKIGEESTVTVPDYNRFHFVADNGDNAEIGGVYGEKVTVKALEEGVKISSDVSVDLTKANKKSAIIAINNPSDHPAGIEKITIDIVSATNADKFIRIVATSGNNGYNAHIYGGFGAELVGSLREKLEDGNYALVDANYGQIVDYNILWAALGLGKLEGDQGANDGWAYNQKRQLTLVYDGGKIGYYSPACKFVPIMDLSNVESFNAADFTNTKLNFTFDKLISNEKAGYTNATHTLEIYGNGVDYTDEFMIDKEGFAISSTEVLKNASGYIGIYLWVQPVGQDNIPAADWVVMDGTYKGAITINGKAYDGLNLKITAENKLFLTTETSELNALFANAAYLKSMLYIEIPAGSTFTYDGKEWKTRDKIGICTYYDGDEMKWQSCTHDSHEYSDEIVVTFGDIKRSRWLGFEMHLKNLGGSEIALPQTVADPKITLAVDGQILLNGAETTSIPLYTSDWNGGVEGKYLLWINTESLFANSAAFDAAKAAGTVYTITIKANTTLTCQGVKYFVAEDVSYKLSLRNGDYSWRVDDGNEDPLYTLDGTVHRSRWHEFEMHLTDAKGRDVALPQSKGVTVNGTVLLNGQAMSEPWFVTSDWDGGSTGNYLLSIKTSDGKVFADEAAFNAAKAAGTVYTITVKAGTILTIEGVEYPIVKDITYKLSLRNGEYAWREAEDLASAKISSNQTRGYQYINFEFIGSSNGFETENWDVFITVADGAKFNDDTLALKRGGYGNQALFFIDNTVNRTAVVGDKITFKAGDYYNATTKLGITLEKDYVLKWDGNAWVLDEK